MQLTDSLDLLPRTKSTTIDKFKLLELHTFYDLLTYIPTRYEDYSRMSTIDTLQEGENVTIQGKVIAAKNVYTRSGLKIQKATIEDTTGKVEITWYNQPYLVKLLENKGILSVAGKVKSFLNTFSVEPAEYEILKTPEQERVHTGRIIPIYSEKKALSTKTIREKMKYALASLTETMVALNTSQDSQDPLEWLPDDILKMNHLIKQVDAYKQIHFPDSLDKAEKARERLAFDELFTLQLSNAIIRKEWENEKVGHEFKVTEFEKKITYFIKSLPFELTSAQKKVIDEICHDLARKVPMNRFVQGDVGSGKTVVAAIAAYVAFLNNYRTMYMAPTEILAQQHFQTISKLFEKIPLKIGLQTGTFKSIKTKKNGEKQEKYDILIGTHALLSETVEMDNVGLIIIDEQHRFGVKQRAVLKKKGKNPHLLTMTATPIPRTVALTLYGELDLSVIDEMPKGRLPIKTWVVGTNKRESAYEWIKKDMSEFKTQTFIICPLIEESEVETMKSIKAAKVEYEHLKSNVFTTWSVGLLHGKLKPKEKNDTMDEFKNKHFDVLVATSVVEVGIDVPNATIMIIEGAERYGLAQLHQLRGRVGRGDKQSYCILFTTGQESYQRLQYFAKTTSGMDLAEFDLKSRGSGDIYGTKQHGYGDLKVATFADFELINQSKEAVTFFFQNYTLDSQPKVKERVERYGLHQVTRD